jgi:hypothetical protein
MCIFLRVIPKENKTLPPSVVVPQNTKRKKLKTKTPHPRSARVGQLCHRLSLFSSRTKGAMWHGKRRGGKGMAPRSKARIGRETVMNQ